MTTLNLHKTRYSLSDSYTVYLNNVIKDNIENTTSIVPIDKRTFTAIINGLCKFIWKLVLEGHLVKFPSKIGSLGIVGKKHTPTFDEAGNPKAYTVVNWKETKALWEKCEECKTSKQLVYQYNEHSQGIKYTAWWSHVGIIDRNNSLYSFQLARTNQREMADKIINGTEYYVINEYDKSSENIAS